MLVRILCVLRIGLKTSSTTKTISKTALGLILYFSSTNLRAGNLSSASNCSGCMNLLTNSISKWYNYLWTFNNRTNSYTPHCLTKSSKPTLVKTVPQTHPIAYSFIMRECVCYLIFVDLKNEIWIDINIETLAWQWRISSLMGITMHLK